MIASKSRLALTVVVALVVSALAALAPTSTVRAADPDVDWVRQEYRPATSDLGFGVALSPDGTAVYDLVTRGTKYVDIVKRRASTGAVIWRTNLSNTSYPIGLAIESLANGDIVVLHAAFGRAGYDVAVTRMTSAGVVAWSAPVAAGLTSPSQGQLTVGPSIFWGLRHGSSANTDLKVGAVSLKGVWQWGRNYSSPYNERIFDMLWHSTTGLMMAGDTEAAIGGGKGKGDAFVWYLGAQGKIDDTEVFVGDGFVAGQALAVAPDGTAYFALIEKVGTQVAEIWKLDRNDVDDRRIMTFTAGTLMQSVRSMTFDSKGFVIVGTARGPVDTATTAPGGDDVYVLRAGLSGRRRTTVMLGTRASELAWRVAQRGSRLYIGGYTAGDMQKGTGNPAATSTDSFVIALNSPPPLAAT